MADRVSSELATQAELSASLNSVTAQKITALLIIQNLKTISTLTHSQAAISMIKELFTIWKVELRLQITRPLTNSYQRWKVESLFLMVIAHTCTWEKLVNFRLSMLITVQFYL